MDSVINKKPVQQHKEKPQEGREGGREEERREGKYDHA